MTFQCRIIIASLMTDLVETQGVVRVACRLELVTECELGKLDRAVEVTHVPGQPAQYPGLVTRT